MYDDKSLVEWDNRYLVGIQMIDDQHKELIELTNNLYAGCLKGDETARIYFKEAIHGAVDYVKFHFAAEEKLLESVQYPDLQDHKKHHETFVKKIIEDVKSFESGKSFVPNEFVRYLKDWILTHIALMDKKYAAYILNLKKQGGLDKQV
jgi:hemerythrin